MSLSRISGFEVGTNNPIPTPDVYVGINYERFIASLNACRACWNKQTNTVFSGASNATPNPVYIFVSVPEHQTVVVVCVYFRVIIAAGSS